MNFEEGEEYELSELPESDLLNSGNLEALGDGRLAAKYGELYVEFEWKSVECIDVTHEDEL